MKKIIFLFLTLFAITFCSAQVSILAKYSEKKISPCATLFGTKPISKNFKFTYFALVQEKWAEAMFGVLYSPTSWLQIGFNCGIEQNPALFRIGGIILFKKDKISFLTLLEKGAGPKNYWYKSTFTYDVTKKLTLGARAWRFNGIGPIIEYKIKDIKLWVMPAYEFEKDIPQIIAGIDIKI